MELNAILKIVRPRHGSAFTSVISFKKRHIVDTRHVRISTINIHFKIDFEKSKNS